jgi:hypothetical protein
MTRRRQHRQEAIQLARRAEREMHRWRVTLTASERADASARRSIWNGKIGLAGRFP